MSITVQQGLTEYFRSPSRNDREAENFAGLIDKDNKYYNAILTFWIETIISSSTVGSLYQTLLLGEAIFTLTQAGSSSTINKNNHQLNNTFKKAVEKLLDSVSDVHKKVKVVKIKWSKEDTTGIKYAVFEKKYGKPYRERMLDLKAEITDIQLGSPSEKHFKTLETWAKRADCEGLVRKLHVECNSTLEEINNFIMYVVRDAPVK